LFQSPETNASFIDGLLEHLFAAAAAQPIGRFSSDSYAIFPWHTGPFWGNDAFVSDGFFDIPTPQMSTWPDRFYHSSMDTPEQMSENTLGRAGAIAGTYLYLLATADSREALWFAGLAARDWKRRICHELSIEALKGNTSFDRLRALGQYMGFQGSDAVKQVLRFAPDDADLGKIIDVMSGDMRDFAAREANKAMELASALSGRDTPPAPGDTEPKDQHEPITMQAGCLRSTIVMKRLRWRRPSDNAFSEAGQVKLRALSERNSGIWRIWNWINGRRTVRELWERVQFGGVVPYDIAAEYLELLVAEGFAVETGVRE
jgi:hypothetical protein